MIGKEGMVLAIKLVILLVPNN